MNIFIVLDSSKMGGIETHVHMLAIALQRKNINCDVILLHEHDPNHPLLDRLQNSHINYRCLTGGLQAYIQLLREERPHLIHTHGYKAGILSRFIGWQLGIPVVSTFHAGEPGTGKLWLYGLLDRYTARLAKAVIAVSASVGEKLPCAYQVVQNFVDVPPYTPPTANTVAFVGRLSYEKGPDLFIEVARLLPNLSFAIYGDGPMVERLTSTAPDNITLHGMVSRMDERWHEIGLLCMPSRHEGLPMAALEAMARGIPVAAFAVGGLPQLIHPNEDGWLASPGNVGELAKHLEQWHQFSSTQRQDFSAKAHARIIRDYSTETGSSKILDIYKSII